MNPAAASDDEEDESRKGLSLVTAPLLKALDEIVIKIKTKNRKALIIAIFFTNLAILRVGVSQINLCLWA